jgi:hypothetical protein
MKLRHISRLLSEESDISDEDMVVFEIPESSQEEIAEETEQVKQKLYSRIESMKGRTEFRNGFGADQDNERNLVLYAAMNSYPPNTKPAYLGERHDLPDRPYQDYDPRAEEYHLGELVERLTKQGKFLTIKKDWGDEGIIAGKPENVEKIAKFSRALDFRDSTHKNNQADRARDKMLRWCKINIGLLLGYSPEAVKEYIDRFDERDRAILAEKDPSKWESIPFRPRKKENQRI